MNTETVGNMSSVTHDVIYTKESDGMVIVLDAVAGAVHAFIPIPNYQEHSVILARPSRIFCPECGASEETAKDEYPFIRMLYALPDMCAH